MWNPFKRKQYANPYYGKGNRALITNVPDFNREAPEEETATLAPVHFTPTKPADPDWEQRRFELVKMLIGQDRRSVVLGKLKATDKQIAAKSRSLADAAIRELQTHPMISDDTGREEPAE